MLIYNGKEYRNEAEQVLKNKEDIARHYAIDRALSNFGIKIVGTVLNVDELPDPLTYQGEYGDGYAVGQPGAYNYYIYTRPDLNAGQPDNYWLNAGPISVVGPQGPQGPQGSQGEPGVSSKWYTGNYPSEPKENDMFLANNGEVFQFTSNDGWQPVTSIKGPQGVQGIQGLQGIQGETGPQGPKGETGDVGGFINIVGMLENADQLPTPSSLNNLTYAYLIEHAGGDDQANDHYDLYIQVGETSDVATWNNVGPFNAATLVTVSGQGQNVWDADTKLDKVTTTTQIRQLYVKEKDGSQSMISFDAAAVPGNVVSATSVDSSYYGNYVAKGSFAVAVPLYPYQCANKKYVDEVADTKLEKVTTTTQFRQAYIKNQDGSLIMYNVGHYNRPAFIVQYATASESSVGAVDEGGTFAVAMPQQPYQAANKKYVDDQIAGVTSNLYQRVIKLTDPVNNLTFMIYTYSRDNEYMEFEETEAYVNYLNKYYYGLMCYIENAAYQIEKISRLGSFSIEDPSGTGEASVVGMAVLASGLYYISGWPIVETITQV